MRRTALALLTTLAAMTGHAAEPFSFGVLGDTPYNRFERTHLPAVIAEMDAELLKVVIHDGDIKNGGERCDDALYEDRLALFRTSHHPFVFVPGDNDWTDCHRNSNGAYDPLERLEKLRGVFFADPRQTHGQYPRVVDTQADDAAFAAYREHQRWQIGPVLFLTLNVPGSGNNYGRKKAPGAEYLARSAAVKAWIEAGFARARSAGLEGVVLVMQANPDIEDFGRWQGQPRLSGAADPAAGRNAPLCRPGAAGARRQPCASHRHAPARPEGRLRRGQLHPRGNLRLALHGLGQSRRDAGQHAPVPPHRPGLFTQDR
jgi:hypothetical protein